MSQADAGIAAALGAGGAVESGADAAGALAVQVVGLLKARNLTAGTAESLTGGLIAGTLTSVPGASAVFEGGIVAYSAPLKAALLDVPAPLLDRVGTVHQDVALAMARGARRRLGVRLAVAVTGVAGPDPVGDLPPGTVHVAVSSASRDRQVPLRLDGDRAAIRWTTVSHALGLILTAILEDNP